MIILTILTATEPIQQLGLSPMMGIFFGGIVMAALIVLKIADFFIEKFREKKKEDDAKEIIEKVAIMITSALTPISKALDNIEQTNKVLPTMSKTLENLEEAGYDTQDKVNKSWALHNKFDEDGRPRWYIPHILPEVLQQVSHTCERIVASQNETLKAFKETAMLQQEILQNQKQFLGALQNFQSQQASVQQGLNLLIQQVITGRSTSTEIISPQPPILKQ